jgi:hypothetical protein
LHSAALFSGIVAPCGFCARIFVIRAKEVAKGGDVFSLEAALRFGLSLCGIFYFPYRIEGAGADIGKAGLAVAPRGLGAGNDLRLRQAVFAHGADLPRPIASMGMLARIDAQDFAHTGEKRIGAMGIALRVTMII